MVKRCSKGLRSSNRRTGASSRSDLRCTLRGSSTHVLVCAFLKSPPIPFIQAIDELVRTDGSWVPSAKRTSLYIRPFTFATESYIGVRVSHMYSFFYHNIPGRFLLQGRIEPRQAHDLWKMSGPSEGALERQRPLQTMRRAFYLHTRRRKRDLPRSSGSMPSKKSTSMRSGP